MGKARWAVLVVAACLVVTVAAVAYAAGQARTSAPEVLRAQKFELLDAEGRVRGQLSMGEDGDSPSIRLLGQDPEKARFAVAVRDESVALAFRGGDGEPRVGLAIVEGGPLALVLYDDNSRERASLTLLPDGTPGLMLFDEHGRAIWSAP